MKNSFLLDKKIDERFNLLLHYDKQNMDNPNLFDINRLAYHSLMNKVINIIKSKFPKKSNVKIADFGCAQGNTSLLLAELGYSVSAIDINPVFLEYSKLKYEKGKISWIQSNFNEINLLPNSFDVAIAGEIIEHCAYPEEILSKILNLIKPGGLLIITTPNGSRRGVKLPTFIDVMSKEQRKEFEEKQFGPEGNDHLFLFTINEIPLVTPKNSKIILKGFSGESSLSNRILSNKIFLSLLQLFPVKFTELCIFILSKIPVLNEKTFYNLFVVLQKIPFEK